MIFLQFRRNSTYFCRKNRRPMLQYLISGNELDEIINIAEQALNNGCRWIRLDLSKVKSSDIEPSINALKEKCDECEAYLSLDNDVETVAQLKVSGTHLGAKDLSKLVDIRKELGEEPIMGLTIEDSAQVPFLPQTAIDYVAVNGSDLENCHKVVKQMRDSNLDEPVVATLTPGISLDELMATGVDGIALCNSSTPPSMLQEILKALDTIVKQRLDML